jgi:ABC-type transport system involved in cytochrome c biogenesis permease subunit
MELSNNWIRISVLTIGIISGGVWANEAWGSYGVGIQRITWLIFATYLHAGSQKVGKVKNSYFGGLGFFVIWICYLGVNFLGKDCIVGYLK